MKVALMAAMWAWKKADLMVHEKAALTVSLMAAKKDSEMAD